MFFLFFWVYIFIIINSDRFRVDFYLKRRAVGAGDPGCGHSRKTCVREPIIYDSFWQEQKVIHFISKPEENWRLLQHFYTFIHFDDPIMDLLYKRFVRDYIHYIDIIFCKAAIIINHLLHEGNGSYTSFHIRRYNGLNIFIIIIIIIVITIYLFIFILLLLLLLLLLFFFFFIINLINPNSIKK